MQGLDSSHLELIVKDLGKYVNDFNAKLVIIDGIISLHRAEFAGKRFISRQTTKTQRYVA